MYKTKNCASSWLFTRIRNKFMDLIANCSTPCHNLFCCDFHQYLVIYDFLAFQQPSQPQRHMGQAMVVPLYFCLPNIINPHLQPIAGRHSSPTHQNTMGVCTQITLLKLYYISSRLVTLLMTLMPLYKPLIFFILLLVSNSSILVFRYAFFYS